MQGQHEAPNAGPDPPTIPAGKAASTVSPDGVTQRSRR